MKTSPAPFYPSVEAINNIKFEDIFTLGDIQQIQDLFSDATGVSSVITHPDGVPITRPSNLNQWHGEDIIKADGKIPVTPEATAQHRDDQGFHAPKPCTGKSLWTDCAGFHAGGRLIANWLIGLMQSAPAAEPLDSSQKTTAIYDNIGFADTFGRLKPMPEEEFAKVSERLSVLVEDLSAKGYANWQQKQHIAELEKSTARLQQSNNILSVTLRSIGDGVITTDASGIVGTMNPMAAMLCGCSMAEAVGKPLHEVFTAVNSATRQAVASMVADVLKSGQEARLSNSTLLLSKSGDEYHIAFTAVPLRNAEDEICGAVLSFVDLTEQYTLRQKLESSERFLKETQTIARLGTYILDIKTGFWTSSELLDDIFGIDAGFEKSLQAWVSLIHPEWQQIMSDYFTYEVIGKKCTFDKEYKIVKPNTNEERWVHGLGEVLFGEDGLPVKMIGTISDITNRRQAEDAVQLSNQRFATLFNKASDGIIHLSTTGKIIGLNESFAQMHGYSIDELLHMDLSDLDTPETAHLIPERMSRILNGETLHFEVEHFHKNGDIINVEVSVSRIVIGDTVYIQAFNRDITARKQAEEALKESEIKYRELVENSPDAISIYSEGKIVFVTQECIRLMAVSGADELIGKSVLQFVHPDSRVFIIERMRKAITENVVLPLSKETFLRPDGSIVHVEVKAMPIILQNKPAVQLIVRDITESRLVHDALRESEEKYRLIFDNSPLGLLSYNEKGVINACNDRFAQIMGSSIQRMVGVEMLGLPDQKLVSAIRQSLCGTNGLYEDVYHTVASGKITPVRALFAPMVIGDGNIRGGVGIIEDISEQKLAKEELKERKEKYRGLSEAAFESIFLSEKGLCIEQNLTAEKTFGYTSEEALVRYGTEWIVPADRERVMQNMLSGTEEPYEATALKKDGTTFPCMLRGKMMHYKGRDVRVTSLTDITARKQAENELKASETKFKDLFEANSDGITIFRINTDGPPSNIIDLNENAAKMVGYTKREMLLLSPVDLEKDVTAAKIEYRTNELLSKGFSFFETILKHKDGHDIFVEIKASVVNYNNQPALMNIMRDITERRQAEIELSEKEHFIKNIAESSPNVIYIYSVADGRNIYTNRSISQLLGYTADELTDDDFNFFETLIHPDDLHQFDVFYDDIENWEADRIFGFEYRILSKDGNWRWFKGSEKEFQRENGKVSSLIGTIQDVTANKLAEDALRKSEEKYRALVDNAFEGIIIINFEGVVLFANQSLIRTFEYTHLDEIVGKNVFEYIGPESVALAIDDMTKVIMGVDLDVAEYCGITSKGNKIWFESIGKIIEYNGTKADIISVRDITAKKEAADFLRASEEKFRLIAENTVDTIAVMDLQLQITYVSPSVEKLRGYSYQEALLQRPEDILTPESLQKVLALYDEILPVELAEITRHENFPTLELEEYHKNGSIIWVELSFSFLRDSNGKPTGIVTVTRDVTGRKKTQRELILAKEKAEESDRLKSAFLANMSHEIRTPMNGILGFAGLLKEPGLTGETQQEYVRIIEKSGARMLNIINNIVDISRIESGQMKVSVSETNIDKQIEYIYSFFKPEAEAKGIRLCVENPVAATEAIIKTDREKIYAIKYTDRGTITFGYTLRQSLSAPDARQEMEGTAETSELEFFVKDTGIGIPFNRQKAIFDRFVQADIADRRAFQGAGLGLSISKAYVEMLGGNIRVESQEGEGSAFYFTVPYALLGEPVQLGEKQLAGEKDAGQGENLKILIVEDDETSGILIALAVKKYSRSVIKVSTGSDAVEACRLNPDIDLIMMDIKMPGMNGYEATRLIRQFNSKVVIIAQTAFGLSGDSEKAIGAGCNDYISKPINIASLKALILKYFAKTAT